MVKPALTTYILQFVLFCQTCREAGTESHGSCKKTAGLPLLCNEIEKSQLRITILPILPSLLFKFDAI